MKLLKSSASYRSEILHSDEIWLPNEAPMKLVFESFRGNGVG